MHTKGAKLTKVLPGYCEIELPFHDCLSQNNGFSMVIFYHKVSPSKHNNTLLDQISANE